MSAAPDLVASVSREQPWPGLMPFTEEAQAYFHGRDREAAELLRLIKRETLTVLFGQSGLGKSSLLNAGLFPRLRAEDFLPVYVRLDVAPEAPPLGAQVLAALRAACERHGVEGPGGEAATLWEFFHRKDADFWSARNRLLTPVLVLDQFEEIFTLGRHLEEMESRCRAFLEELADLVEDRVPRTLAQRLDADPALAEHYDFARHGYKAVLSFREDYLAEFEGLRGAIRSIMQNRLRLTRMNGEQAREAVLQSGGHLVEAGVAEQVIRFVAAPRAHARGDDDLARLEVEPALLSVVCRELNSQRLRRGQSHITADMLLGGAQQQIIRDFYESSMEGIDPRVREFVEDQLLTEAGYRDSYAYDDALALPGVTREAIDRLIGRRLLRLEERSGVLRVELTHDLLTQVARESRDLRQQREAEHRAAEAEAVRKRRGRRLAAIAAVGMAGAVGLAVVFAVLLNQSNTERRRLVETQSLGLLEQANDQIDQRVAGEPQAILAKAIELNPANRGAVGRAVSYLSQRTFPRVIVRAQAKLEGEDRIEALAWAGNDAVRVRSARGAATLAAKPASGVQALAFAPAASDATAPVRGLSRGKPSEAAWGTVRSPMAVSAGGEVAVWIERERRIRVSDRRSGAEASIEVPDGLQAPIVLSRDGRRFLVRSARSEVLVYAIGADGTPQPRERIPAADGSLLLAGEGGAIVVALSRDMIRVYGLGDDRLRTLAHPLPVNALEVSADGSRLVSACQDKAARVWDLASGGLVSAPMRHDGAVLAAAFSDDGRRVVTGSLDGTARIWSPDTGEQVAEPLASGAGVVDARLSPDGTHAVTLGRDGSIAVWQVGRLAAGALAVRLPAGISALEAAADRALVFVGTSEGDLVALRVAGDGTADLSATQAWSVRLPERATLLRLSPDGRRLAVATDGPLVHLLDAESGKASGPPMRHRGAAQALRFSPDGTILATGAADGAARLWRVQTHRQVGFTMPHGRESVTRLAFSRDGKLLLTGAVASGAGTLRLWEMRDQELVARVAAGRDRLALAEFSGEREVVAVFDAAIARWRVDARKRPSRMSDDEDDAAQNIAYAFVEEGRLEFGGDIWAAGMSPDGARIVAGGLDGAARLVDLRRLRPFGDVMKSVGSVEAADFTADGRWVVTRSRDRVARVWDAASGHAVTDVARHDGDLAGAVLAGGGAVFASGARDRTLLLSRVGLDFPSPAPAWLPDLLQVAGGGRQDEAGTLSWIANRGEQMRMIGTWVTDKDSPWWREWAVRTIARIAGAGT